jgi:hypothetical protein
VDQVLGRLSLADLLAGEQQVVTSNSPKAVSLPVVSHPQ